MRMYSVTASFKEDPKNLMGEREILKFSLTLGFEAFLMKII